MTWFDDANTTNSTPAIRAASNTLYVPMTFELRTSGHRDSTVAAAARCTIAWGAVSATIERTVSKLLMSPTAPAWLEGFRLCATRSYLSLNRSISTRPISPLAPVMRTRFTRWVALRYLVGLLVRDCPGHASLAPSSDRVTRETRRSLVCT